MNKLSCKHELEGCACKLCGAEIHDYVTEDSTIYGSSYQVNSVTKTCRRCGKVVKESEPPVFTDG